MTAGELLVLLGPSGCGKTTTLRLIAGLLQPNGGDVLFDGRSVLATPPEKRGATMVFQEDALFPFRTVGQNIEFGLRMQQVERSQRPPKIASCLSAVRLDGFEDRYPDELSGGQRRRVALARALAVDPKILLLDEPLANLEPELRVDLRETLIDICRAAGITTIVVTHDHTEAVALADRIAVMIEGRVRQVGPPAEVIDNPVDEVVARFLNGAKH